MQDSVAASNPFTSGFKLSLDCIASPAGAPQHHPTSSSLSSFEHLRLHCHVPNALGLAVSQVGLSSRLGTLHAEFSTMLFELPCTLAHWCNAKMSCIPEPHCIAAMLILFQPRQWGLCYVLSHKCACSTRICHMVRLWLAPGYPGTLQHRFCMPATYQSYATPTGQPLADNGTVLQGRTEEQR